MAFTTADLAQLKSMIIRGVTSESYQGRIIQYASMADLLKAYEFGLSEVNRAAAAAAATAAGGGSPDEPLKPRSFKVVCTGRDY